MDQISFLEKEKEKLLNLIAASEWTSKYTKRKVSISNISYLIQYGKMRNKFENYSPESNSMPFHYRLLGKDRMALFSFIHSLNTTFGTPIFEPVATRFRYQCQKTS